MHWCAVCERFKEQTGFALDVQLILPLLAGDKVVAAGAVHAMEINEAYGLIRAAFVSQPHQPLKMGLKAGSIELAFISPQVGARYKDTLAALTQKTGYPMHVRPHPDQARMRTWLEQRVGQDRLVAFGFYADAGNVRIKLDEPLEQPLWCQLSADFEHDTGFKLFGSGQR